MMTATSTIDYVAVDDEPMHHELWRTATMRVLRAEFPARSSCQWHEHVRMTIYICITELDILEHKLGAEPVPLQLERGFVLVRDHQAHPLIHTAITKTDDVMLLGVELYRPSRDERARGPMVTVGDCVHRDSSSHVYRITTSQVLAFACSLETEAVLVALDNCTVTIDGHISTMDPGCASPLAAGTHTVQLDSGAMESCTLYLVAVFSHED